MNNKTIPSAKLVRWVRLFHLGLGFFLLFGTLLLNSCSSSSMTAAPLKWKQADTIAPALLQLAISENTSSRSDLSKKILVASIPTKERQRLHIFNYNSSNTCGKLGCLYVAYWDKNQSSYQKVLSLYLSPDLPSKQTLMSVSSEIYNSPLPCLGIKQVQDTLQKLTYCFEGNFYRAIRSDRVKLPKS